MANTIVVEDIQKTEDISRQSIYIEDGETKLFGWYHTASAAPSRDCAAVLCYPQGYEYVHSHRSLRHLADQLARGGIPTLRFDYHGTGDSPGDDLDPDRVGCWTRNIKAAMAEARRLSGCSQVCLIGLRLGAALVALVAAEVEVSYLVLWHPCVQGRHYIREMQALALLAENDSGRRARSDAPAGAIESAGFLLAADTVAQLRTVNLLKLNLKIAHHALVIGRDDLEEDPSLAAKLNEDGIATAYLCVPGFADMMAEPQFTVVPAVAITAIADWLVRHVEARPPRETRSAVGSPAPHLGPPTITFEYRADGAKMSETRLTEQPCHFGSRARLFGILSYQDKPATDKPAIVLSNAGSVHHIGPNRIYVELARSLSALGYTCLRMDLEGIGDSIAAAGAPENHPYPATAVRDTDEALRYLSAQFGCSRYIVLGLCSGAHTAFHAAVGLRHHSIVESILINPLTFQWEEGMTLETTQSVRHFQDVAYYKQSARSVNKWKTLLKGQANLRYLGGVALSQATITVKSLRDSLIERFYHRDSTPVAAHLRQHFALERRLGLFISSTDPGYAILLAGARSVARQGVKTGKIHLQFIQDADHTFTQRDKRRQLIAAVCNHLQSRFGAN